MSGDSLRNGAATKEGENSGEVGFFESVQAAGKGSRRSRKRMIGGLAALWVVTASVPAIVVWLVMRHPGCKSPACNTSNKIEHRASLAPGIVVAHGDPVPVVAMTVVATTSLPQSSLVTQVGIPMESEPEVSAVAATDASAPNLPTVNPPDSSEPLTVVVATDAVERIRVKVASVPAGAKVLRRGKEVGRAPLIIEIGKGEHRTFEVSSPGFATRKLTLDGEKTEVVVKLNFNPKPPTAAFPAP